MKPSSTTARGVAAVALLTGAFVTIATPAPAQTTEQRSAEPPAAATPPPSVVPEAVPGGTAGAAAERAPAPSAATNDALRSERRDGDAHDNRRESIVDASQLEPGANSFTEGQARGRMEAAGFTAVQDLRKDDQGFWRARATHNGSPADVAMDFRGRIAAGPGVAALGTGAGTAVGGTTAAGGGGMAPGASTMPSTAPSAASRAPDGTPGNPPSTVTGRAVDRMQGETPRSDGTPGNPPGTAAGRALDRATGSDTTGTNPPAAQSGTSGPAR